MVTLTVDDPAAVSGTAPEETACAPDNRDNTVVVIGTNCLGSGDDTLGATLMKGFLYALSQQERLPAPSCSITAAPRSPPRVPSPSRT